MNSFPLAVYVSSALKIAIPAGLAFWVARKQGGWVWRMVGVGVIVFLLVHFGKIVVWNMSGPSLLGTGVEGWDLFRRSLGLGIIASVFEEGARYFVVPKRLVQTVTGRAALRRAKRQDQETQVYPPLVAGLGLASGWALGESGFYTIYQGYNLVQGVLGDPKVVALWNPYWPVLFVGVLERVIALVAHIGFTALVIMALRYRKKTWWFIALLSHLIIDTGVQWWRVKMEVHWGVWEPALAIGEMVKMEIFFFVTTLLVLGITIFGDRKPTQA